MIQKHFIDSDIRWPSQRNNDIIVCEGNIECLIEWVDLGGDGEAPRIKVFDSHWAELPQSDLLRALSEIRPCEYGVATKERVKAALKSHGFEDWTRKEF